MSFNLDWRTQVFGIAILSATCVAALQGDEPVAVRAFQLRMDGQIDNAKEMLERTLEKEMQNASAWLELARLEFQRSGKTRELDSAQRAIDRAISVAPANPLYYRWAARIATYNGILKSSDRAAMIEQFKKAAAAAEKAVSLDPNDHDARRTLVALYGNNPPEFGGNIELAEKQVKALESRSPIDGAVARCELAFKNQPEKKLAHWKELAKTHEKNAVIQENIAIQYAWVGDEEQTSVHAKRALALNPQRSHVLIDLSRAFALQKKLEPAETFAREYLNSMPPGPRALRSWTYMALGRIQDMKGNKAASVESLNQAKQLDPYCWFTMTPPPEELFSAP